MMDIVTASRHTPFFGRLCPTSAEVDIDRFSELGFGFDVDDGFRQSR